MTRWIGPVIALLLGGIAGFYLVLHALPGVIMGQAMEAFDTLGGGANQVGHVPRVDETSRNVVRPSPDILYSACLYDLAEGPLNVTVPPLDPERYASVSFFDARTNNFETINMRDVQAGETTEIFVYPPTWHTVPGYDLDGMDVVIGSPTQRGVLLFRQVLAGGVSVETADELRQGLRCEAREQS